MDINEALELILLPGSSSEYQDSDVSNKLDFSQHGDVDYKTIPHRQPNLTLK